MTSSDAPQPPGGPQRDDEPARPFAPDAEREPLPDDDDSSEATTVPPVTDEPTQDDQAAELQEENAETSLDQPSS